MAASAGGKPENCSVTIIGRAVLGIASEECLAVDASANLAVDELADLVVSQGVTWAGATPLQSIPCTGAGVAILVQP